MGLSNDVDQQRSNEAKMLWRWVGCGLTGSLMLHSLSLFLTIRDPGKVKPRPTEVVIVPRKSPPEVKQVKPSPVPQPDVKPEIKPELNPEPLPELVQPLRRTVAASQVLPPGVMPEGEADAERDESPLVGSGLAEGDGGFSEGIGLNRSNSTIRGSGGGERRGVEGGVPGGIIAPPIVTAPVPPIVEERVAPQPVSDPRLAVCRRCPSPEYPRSALQTGAEGRVQMAVDLDSRGRVVGVRLANSSGNAALDRAVLETVREQWRFESVRGGANNIPVEVFMTVAQSELNQQARDWGDRTAIEIPDAGFASPPIAPTAAQPVPSSESVAPIVESAPEVSPEPIPESVPESVPPAIPEPVLESVPPVVPEPVPETVQESLPESSPEPSVEAIVEPIETPEPDAIAPEASIEMPLPEPIPESVSESSPVPAL
jgi:TonB family protein